MYSNRNTSTPNNNFLRVELSRQFNDNNSNSAYHGSGARAFNPAQTMPSRGAPVLICTWLELQREVAKVISLRHHEDYESLPVYTINFYGVAAATPEKNLLFQAFSILRTIIHLDLSCTGLNESDVQTVLEALKQGDVKLIKLHLGGNNISDQGAHHIANYLSFAKDLEALNLRSNAIGDRGATSIAKSVSTHGAITLLNLSSNKISDRGAKSLSYAVVLNKSLKNLLLFGNQIKDSIQDIAEVIRVSKTLRSLDLWCNMLGPRGATVLGRALANSFAASLRELCIGNNNIGDEGSIELAKGLTSNNSLEILDVSNNNISDIGGLAFVECLRANNKLYVLNIRDNELTIRSCYPLASITKSRGRGYLNMSRNVLPLADCQHLTELLYNGQDKCKAEVVYSPKERGSDLYPTCLFIVSPKEPRNTEPSTLDLCDHNNNNNSTHSELGDDVVPSPRKNSPRSLLCTMEAGRSPPRSPQRRNTVGSHESKSSSRSTSPIPVETLSLRRISLLNLENRSVSPIRPSTPPRLSQSPLRSRSSSNASNTSDHEDTLTITTPDTNSEMKNSNNRNDSSETNFSTQQQLQQQPTEAAPISPAIEPSSGEAPSQTIQPDDSSRHSVTAQPNPTIVGVATSSPSFSSQRMALLKQKISQHMEKMKMHGEEQTQQQQQQKQQQQEEKANDVKLNDAIIDIEDSKDDPLLAVLNRKLQQMRQGNEPQQKDPEKEAYKAHSNEPAKEHSEGAIPKEGSSKSQEGDSPDAPIDIEEALPSSVSHDNDNDDNEIDDNNSIDTKRSTASETSSRETDDTGGESSRFQELHTGRSPLTVTSRNRSTESALIRRTKDFSKLRLELPPDEPDERTTTTVHSQQTQKFNGKLGTEGWNTTHDSNESPTSASKKKMEKITVKIANDVLTVYERKLFGKKKIIHTVDLTKGVEIVDDQTNPKRISLRVAGRGASESNLTLFLKNKDFLKTTLESYSPASSPRSLRSHDDSASSSSPPKPLTAPSTPTTPTGRGSIKSSASK